MRCSLPVALLALILTPHVAGKRHVTDQAAIVDSEGNAEETAKLMEKMKQMSTDFAQFQADAEENDQLHVDYSAALFSTARELQKKYAPKLSVGEDEIKAALDKSGSLRDSVATYMGSGESALTEQKQMLFERARRALSAEQASVFDESVKRKDVTPCIHVLENANGYPLADFDAPGGQYYGSREECSNNCLQACKMALFSGASRFKVDPDDMSAMGMSQREISLVGGAPQIGAKCDGSSCACLDADQTKQKVTQMFFSGMQIDLTKDEPFESYPTEMVCMDACHDEMGVLEGYGMQVKFEGVCMDEAYSN